MPVFDHIPVDLSEETIAHALRLDRREGGKEIGRDLRREAISLLEPRAFYRMAFIEKKAAEEVRIENRIFRSRVLRVNLEKAEKVFAFIVTVGGALEKHAASAGDLLDQYYLENLADLALQEAADYLNLHLRDRFGFKNLSRMSPGSLPDWPISEQVPLFDLLGDVESKIGVRLTDSLLMLPRKSISGILYPSEESFFSCCLCPRKDCVGRQTPYDPDLRKEYEVGPPPGCKNQGSGI